jgi:hypothetical protein
MPLSPRHAPVSSTHQCQHSRYHVRSESDNRGIRRSAPTVLAATDQAPSLQRQDCEQVQDLAHAASYQRPRLPASQAPVWRSQDRKIQKLRLINALSQRAAACQMRRSNSANCCEREGITINPCSNTVSRYRQCSVVQTDPAYDLLLPVVGGGRKFSWSPRKAGGAPICRARACAAGRSRSNCADRHVPRIGGGEGEIEPRR